MAMIGWLKNTNGMEKKKIEPGATFSAVEDHWKQIMEVMENSKDADGAETVISHLGQMISFLRMARVETRTENTCKEFWLQNKCSDKVIKWLHYLQIEGVQFPPEVESKLVTMLHSLCEVASKDGELLGYAKEIENEEYLEEKENWDGAYSLASLLLEYSLRNEGNLGETARYCFILLIQLASKYPRLEKNLTQGAGRGLTNVVISGLSACFSTLPTFTHSSREQIRAFTIQLRFVDEVCKASSPSVVTTISDCFLNAFLLSVIQPAMTQDQENSDRLHNQHDPYITSLHEEIAMVTYYFQIVCEQMTNPCLIKSLISFTNSALLPLLIKRISHPNVSVVTATLRLFNVLFTFYCEDFWYQTILRYLVPENHLMVSQRNTQLREIDFHESSVRLLSLVPSNVVDAISPEVLTTHYLQYLSCESQRFVNTVMMVTNNSNTIPFSYCSSISDKEVEDDDDRQSNLIFPLWKLKYDGTDVISKVKSANSSRPTSAKEVEKKMPPKDGEHSNSSENKLITDPLTPTREELITISFDEATPQNQTVQLDRSELPSMERLAALTINDTSTNSRPESPESDGLSAQEIASFGAFIDSIFVQLSNWPHLDLQVILVLTELVSTIAAARIPLITSVLLDSNLTLQPYYVTFTSLLKRIRHELELQLKFCPPAALSEIWNKIDDTHDDNRRRSSIGLTVSSALSTINRSTPPSNTNTDLGEKIIKGTAIFSSAMQSLFGGKKNPAAIATPASPNTSTNNSPSVQFVGPQESRYIVRHQSQNDEAVKAMALRAIYFSHWVFELAAICQQLSWKNI